MPDARQRTAAYLELEATALQKVAHEAGMSMVALLFDMAAMQARREAVRTDDQTT